MRAFRERRLAGRGLHLLAAGFTILMLGGPSPPAQSNPAGANPAVIPASLPGAPGFSETLRSELAANLSSRGPGYEPRTRNRRPDGSPLYTNRLLLEASPYLQQHAHNPVNWFPWSDEAFATAERSKRPVLVSIGYSTCHWCHVMEEESFDDPELAKYLNQHFIAIKVDREARPDVDAVYMAAIHAMGQRGGWPLNVWVTPSRTPFYGGTYFPPDDRGGRPGFLTVLQAIQDEWANGAEALERRAQPLTEHLRRQLEGNVAEETRVPPVRVISDAVSAYSQSYDETWGGLRGRTKFPSSLPIRLLLRHHRRNGDARALEMAEITLERMASGGMRDHLGGGFHRYSTDPSWMVPHFEKMLYDNALLAVAYLEAWQVTRRSDFERVAREILDYIAREMTTPDGAFYSATDADSAGPSGESEEGRFFTWTPSEVDAALAPPEAASIEAWYGITAAGNYEGRTILHTRRQAPTVAAQLGISVAELRERLERGRRALYAARAQRPAPLRDDKILAAWNGLMISAFARAALILGDPSYGQRAVRAANFVLSELRPDDRLRRLHLEGRADGPAFLEDYAFLIAGLLDLYEAVPDTRWLREAVSLQDVLERNYADTSGGGYWKTAHDQAALIAREKPGQDGAVPSGNSVAAMNLVRLSELTGRDLYSERATLLFSAFSKNLERSPRSLAEMLLALDFLHDRRLEIVIVKPNAASNAEAMLKPLRETFSPNQVVSRVTEGSDLDAHAQWVPHVEGRVARAGEVTAYVCENRVCQFPTTVPEEFAKQLGGRP